MRCSAKCIWKTALFAGGSAILCGVAYSIVKKTNLLKVRSKKKRQAGLDNMYCIYLVLVHANQSIDVCMPSLMSETMTNCLMNLQKKTHAKIRVVIHNSTDYYEQVLMLAGHGIEVKVIDSANLEHEFILMDAAEDVGEAVALIGALDYEVDRVNCNRDNALLINDAVVAKALKSKFDRVWDTVIFNIDDIKIN